MRSGLGFHGDVDGRALLGPRETHSYNHVYQTESQKEDCPTGEWIVICLSVIAVEVT